jgi:hypothetical protein
MSAVRLRVATAAVLAALVAVVPAHAQSGDGAKGGEPQKKAAQNFDPAQERQRQLREFAEAERDIQGGAGQPECVWLGRRVVSLLWRDDLDTAFRHLDLYDRFGCPGGHIQQTFRCLVRNGNIDPKVPESLHQRVHACWVDPSITVQNGPAAGSSAPTR